MIRRKTNAEIHHLAGAQFAAELAAIIASANAGSDYLRQRGAAAPAIHVEELRSGFRISALAHPRKLALDILGLLETLDRFESSQRLADFEDLAVPISARIFRSIKKSNSSRSG